MSPRPKRKRKVWRLPFGKGFGPLDVKQEGRERISLHFEEYEAIRMVDYLDMSHEHAASLMNVSRPTFTRIYDKARKKVGQCLVENSVLEFSGGDIELDERWAHCSSCKNYYDHSLHNAEKEACSDCKMPKENHFPLNYEKEEVYVVPCYEQGMDAKVADSFAHCACFAFIGTNSGSTFFQKNPFEMVKSCPAGGLRRFFREWKIQGVWVNDMGRNAADILMQSSIEINYLPEGIKDLKEVLLLLKQKELVM